MRLNENMIPELSQTVAMAGSKDEAETIAIIAGIAIGVGLAVGLGVGIALW